jgi:Calpain family cysteine protease
LVAFAEKSNRFKKLFVIQEVADPGVMAFNVYLRGMPFVVTVDDLLPFINSNGISTPMFANIGLDGGLNGPLLEKLWAKMSGTYERTAAGWQHEALHVLTGAPSYDYLTSSYTSD